MALDRVRTRAAQLRRRRHILLTAAPLVVGLLAVVVAITSMDLSQHDSHVRTVPADTADVEEAGFVQASTDEGDTVVSLQAGGGGAIALPPPPVTLPLPPDTTTSLPPTPTYREIAFVREGEIWLMHEDGSDATPLTDRDDHVLSAPDWRPDGSALLAVETGAEAALAEPVTRLVVVTLQGVVNRLAEDTVGVANPKWSPDGSRIAYERRGVNADTYDELWVIDADGSDARRIVERYVGFSITWSPDGRELAYECQHDGTICITTVDGGGTRSLPGSDSWIAPVWGPDGRLAVVQRLPADPALLSVNPDGTEARLIGMLPTFPSSIDWAPRGQALVFSMPEGTSWSCRPTPCPWGPRRIFRIEADGSQLSALTGGAIDEQPTWSPVTANRRTR
ncbi:MAG TPA: hypothetical protein VFF24_06525 [Acidimicrobiia bacterium]|nr:hypothetical protein [Acidimicrobiia bacterium]